MKIHINYIKNDHKETLLINLLEAYGNSVVKKIELDPQLLKELSGRIYKQLALFQKKKESSPANPTIDKEIERDIKYLGKELFTLLFENIKTEISSSSDKDLVFSFDEKLFYTPFEILYDGKDFLCLKHNLTKQVISEGIQGKQSSQKNDQLNAVILSNPSLDRDLEAILKEERNNLYDQLKKNRRINVDPPVVGERITTTYFNDLWDKNLIYYAGHSRSQKSEETMADSRMDDQMDYGLKLSGDQYLTPQMIEKMDLTHVKLFYVNSCESLLPPSDDEANLFTSFLKSGVENVIGNLMEVHNKPAGSFANYFYTYLLKGHTIAEAIRRSRLQSIKEYGYSELIWLVTSFYGDSTWKLPTFDPKTLLKPGLVILSISIIAIIIYGYNMSTRTPNHETIEISKQLKPSKLLDSKDNKTNNKLILKKPYLMPFHELREVSILLPQNINQLYFRFNKNDKWLNISKMIHIEKIKDFDAGDKYSPGEYRSQFFYSLKSLKLNYDDFYFYPNSLYYVPITYPFKPSVRGGDRQYDIFIYKPKRYYQKDVICLSFGNIYFLKRMTIWIKYQQNNVQKIFPFKLDSKIEAERLTHIYFLHLFYGARLYQLGDNLKSLIDILKYQIEENCINPKRILEYEKVSDDYIVPYTKILKRLVKWLYDDFRKKRFSDEELQNYFKVNSFEEINKKINRIKNIAKDFPVLLTKLNKKLEPLVSQSEKQQSCIDEAKNQFERGVLPKIKRLKKTLSTKETNELIGLINNLK
ncbi:MAG: hypothetical protein IEMM0008_0753 [bacterium]|nr:MAG: hypothetical protein IEMM0008_0753 [bacterium]